MAAVAAMAIDGDEEMDGESEVMSSQESASSGASVGEERRRRERPRSSKRRPHVRTPTPPPTRHGTIPAQGAQASARLPPAPLIGAFARLSGAAAESAAEPVPPLLVPLPERTLTWRWVMELKTRRKRWWNRRHGGEELALDTAPAPA